MSNHHLFIKLKNNFNNIIVVILLFSLLTFTTFIFSSLSTNSNKAQAVSGSQKPVCVKFENSDIGKNNVSKVLGTNTITLTNFVSKSDEQSEYVGFSYSISNYAAGSIKFTVKYGTTISPEITALSSGSWVNPNGTSGSSAKAISYIEFCLTTIVTVANTSTPTMTPTIIPTLTMTPTQTLTPTTTPTLTSTPTITSTMSPTLTSTPTNTPTSTPMISPTVTLTPTKVPTNTPTSTSMPSPTRVPEEIKVTLCHATGSSSHPFQKITVDSAGAAKGHMGSSHQNGEDIIPPFVFEGQTLSQNWTTVGQSIFNNNCELAAISPTSIPTTTSTLSPTITNTPTTTPTSTNVPTVTMTPTTTMIPTATLTQIGGIGAIGNNTTVTPSPTSTPTGQVLGAVSLPNTGISTKWFVLTILTFLSGLGMIIVNRVRKQI